MARPDPVSGMPRLITMAAVIVVIVALYLGKEVLMPLALGVLFCFLLAPLVTRVERAGLGRIPAVVIVTLLTFAFVGSLTYFVGRQLVNLTTALPAYRDNIHARIVAVRGQHSPISRAARSVEELAREISPTQPATASAPERAAWDGSLRSEHPATPIPVKVVPSDDSSFTTFREALSWLIGPLGTAVIVVVFVVFMLIQREDLRDRVIYLLGRGHIHLTTQALDDASYRISRYLLMQLLINFSYGVPVAVGLYLLGLPNPLAWGLLAALLRYLPYIGPWFGAGLPTLLSLAIFPDWWHPLAVVALFITLELVSNNLEPWLYGSSTGLSSVAVIAAAVFWTWLWGPIGLLLATPLTVCLVVAGKYVAQLEFLNILLGDEPVWDPGNRYYQRLLAMDEEEAADLVEEYLEEHSLIGVYDDMILPALHMAERDRHRGHLSADREEFIRRMVEEVIEEMEDLQAPLERTPAESEEEAEKATTAGTSSNGKPASLRTPRTAAALPEPPVNPPMTLCLPARDEADELAARMFAQVLRKAGFPARVGSAESLASEMMDQVERSHADIVCISAMPPAASAHSRYLCKRLRSRFDKIKLIVGLWNAAGDLARAKERLTCLGSDKVVRRLEEALAEIRQFNIPPVRGTTVANT